MVRLWGDVPLLTEELDPEAIRTTASRNSVNEVFGQIISDLEFASTNLPSGGNAARATQIAADILHAKVLIRQGKHGEAIPLLRSVDASGLIPISEVWDANNKLNDEMIFVIRFKADVPTESHGRWYETVETPLVSEDLRQAYIDAGDVLRGPLIEPNNDLGGPPIPLKFQEAPFGGGSYGSDYPVIRKADVVLLLAESLNEQGYVPDGEAFDLLNLVRARAGLSALASIDLATQDAFRDAVFEERRLEFALEGKRWFDLQRSGKST